MFWTTNIILLKIVVIYLIVNEYNKIARCANRDYSDFYTAVLCVGFLAGNLSIYLKLDVSEDTIWELLIIIALGIIIFYLGIRLIKIALRYTKTINNYIIMLYALILYPTINCIIYCVRYISSGY